MANQHYGGYNDRNRNQGGGDNRPRVGNNQRQEGRFNQGSGYGNDNPTPQQSPAERKFNQLIYKSDWIKKEADPDLVVFAEEAGKFMANNNLTNSKIRSIYGEIKRIQMSTYEREKSAFVLLKPKVAYALGREEKNKREGLLLFKMIFDSCSQDVTDQKSYINFCNLMEAILAYHKSYGGN